MRILAYILIFSLFISSTAPTLAGKKIRNGRHVKVVRHHKAHKQVKAVKPHVKPTVEAIQNVEAPSEIKVEQTPENTFSFDDLVQLSKTRYPEGELKEKLDFVLNNAEVHNITEDSTTLPFKRDPRVGDFIRVASWNIDRGITLDNLKLLFTDTERALMDIKNKDPNLIKKIQEEAEIFKNSDIFVMTEVDVGMPRTKYRNVPDELAKTLNFNYAYGVEFVEVDPAHLGLENYKWSEERFLFKNEKYEVDKSRYKGLHGTMILSRYPISNAGIIRLPLSYDWFSKENTRISELETLKRTTAELIFREDMIREIRHGSRIALVADITVPGLDTPITVVAVHLENRAIPKERREQIKYLLSKIYDIKNPVVIAGDFNTMCADGTPTSIKRELSKKLKDPEFIAKNLILYSMPYSIALNSIVSATNFARRYTDPTVANIPIVAPNPERGLFSEIKNADFADHHTFDFRGTRGNSAGWKGMLGNSNERGFKGFVPTFIFERPLLVGKFKLDWIFVKSYLNKPEDKKGPYKLAPAFGRTLFELNYEMIKPFSDHVPITVDLPLNEPPKKLKNIKESANK